jgi:hypothetical protein
MSGAEEAVIANLDKALGQHVLQKTTDQLLGGNSAILVITGVGIFVAR